MGLKFTYTLIAPFYDLVARRAFAQARRASLEQLPRHGHSDILLSGIGTGLDLPYLAPCHRYAALDLNRAMLARGLARAGALDIGWTQGDSMNLPFGNASFDYAVLHLILAVVPDPAQALRETARAPSTLVIAFIARFLARPGPPHDTNQQQQRNAGFEQ